MSPAFSGSALAAEAPEASERIVEFEGHFVDTGIIDRAFDAIAELGGTFETQTFQVGVRREQTSLARLKISAPSADTLQNILERLSALGARVLSADADARLETVIKDGVAPDDFYSTSIFPTDVRIAGKWIRVSKQRMDAVLVIDAEEKPPSAKCTLLRDLRAGEKIVCGAEGIRTHPVAAKQSSEEFSFMSAGVSSERRVELAVDEIAFEMRRVRERGGKIVVVAGPVVIHTGGAEHLSNLIRCGYVQALLGGNAIAVHDIEQAMFGTSLGVDMSKGVGVHGGHRHHLKAINTVRGCGSIDQAVEQGYLQGGVMYECVKNNVPFALAGSIRDDGPLPETMMDLLEAQSEYTRLIEGAEIILMLSSMLHSIGTGNMTPSGVKLICVDISPAVVTKLADRGSVESVGIVTDVGLFLNLLTNRLCA